MPIYIGGAPAFLGILAGLAILLWRNRLATGLRRISSWTCAQEICISTITTLTLQWGIPHGQDSGQDPGPIASRLKVAFESHAPLKDNEQTVCKDDPVHSLTCLPTQLAVYSDVCDYQVLGDLRRGASRLCQVDVGSSNTFDSIKAKIPSKEGIFCACSGRSIWKGAVCDLVWLPVRDTFCISCARIEALFSFLEAHRKKTAEVLIMNAPNDEYSAEPLRGFEANEPPKATKCLDAVEVDPG